MTTLEPPTGSRIAADAESTPTASDVAQSASTPVLITEQQVAFSSSAALAPAPTRRWNPARALGMAVRALFTRPEKPPARRHYSRRPAFIEDAAMAREMRRL